MSADAPRMKGPIAWMAQHPVAPNLIVFICLAGGLLVWSTMRREVYPDTVIEVAQIVIPYPGASPEEVEKSIVLVVEESVRGLDGVKEVFSISREGVGVITVELERGENLERRTQEIRSEIDRVRSIPDEAEEAEISLFSRKQEVMELQIYGDVPEIVLHEFAENARDALLEHPGISQVELIGAKPLEISIEIPQENLRRYNLTLSAVARRLGEAAVEVPGGGIKTESGEILMRMSERRYYGREFAVTPLVTAPDGTQILLEDLATIHDGFEEVDMIGRYNGLPAIGIEVYRIGDQTPGGVSSATREVLDSLNATMPAGVQVAVIDDDSEAYTERMNLLLRNAALGIVLVFALLATFLEIRLAFWVMMGIPISFLGGILFLPWIGISLNMVSIFAFIVALGIVVDDAIVIGENIYSYHERGHKLTEAAVLGARELATPVTFSILTNVATFMPLAFVPGMIGKFFWMIPGVVVTVFLISLFESVFILPHHLGHQKEHPRSGLLKIIHIAQQGFSKRFASFVRNVYGPILNMHLHHRYVVVCGAVALLLVVGAWPMSGRMGMTQFPTVESDFARADLTLPFGTAVEHTQELTDRIYRAAVSVAEESGHPELIEGAFTLVGLTGAHQSYLEIYLANPETSDAIMGTEEFVNRWRKKVGAVAGVENLSFSADYGGPGGRGRGLTVELSHRDSEVLRRASADLAEFLSGYSIVSDIDDGFEPGKEQINFKVKAEGESLGLTAAQVARQVRDAFYGSEVLRQQRGRNEVKVMVRLPREERRTEYTLEQLMLRTPGGAEVPLREVVEMERGNAYTVIERRNGRRVIQVEADVTPRSRSLEVITDIREQKLPEMMALYPGLSVSFEGRQADINESLGSLRVNFVVALLVVYALLAIPFRSYSQPLIIMTSIPFGIIGAIVGHLIMGYSLSIVSMFGIIALSGVVVNDGLVLIDSANRKRREGMSPHDAVLNSAIGRFRPIVLTTLTTFCGLTPIIFETSRQARFLIPMALSLGFGILFGTFIILLLIPSLYLLLDDIHRLIRLLRYGPSVQS